MTQKQCEVIVFDSIDVLFAMLTTCRPAGSRTEREFIRRFIMPTGAQLDRRGNAYLRIGNAPILWSSHTDTVHDKEGTQTLRQVGKFGIGVAKSSNTSCLGADDTAGVWLMLELIRRKIEGLYVFHRAEEGGCKGSRWIAKNNPKFFDGIKFAIALDRRNKDDIITHQSGTRCCSDEFAKSLGDQLDMGYKACTGGSFTDTASYTGLIGECTNLSVGYSGAHSSSEELDGQFLIALRDKLVTIDVNKLVAKREAGTVERLTYQSRYTNYYGGSDNYGSYEVPGRYYPGFFPRAGHSGFYDARGNFHFYSDVEDEYGNAMEFGNWNTYFPPAMKDYELRSARRRWWAETYTPGTYTNRYGSSMGGGSSWYNRAKAQQSIADQKRRNPDLYAITSVQPTTGKTTKVKNLGGKRRKKRVTTAAQDEEFFNDRRPTHTTLVGLCRQHPEEVASYIEEQGVNADDIAMYILDCGLPLRGYL